MNELLLLLLITVADKLLKFSTIYGNSVSNIFVIDFVNFVRLISVA